MNYNECNLPKCLEDSIQNYDKNKNTSLWDCYYCEFQSDINVCEVEGLITEEQAWYLREKYLGLKKCYNGTNELEEDEYEY